MRIPADYQVESDGKVKPDIRKSDTRIMTAIKHAGSNALSRSPEAYKRTMPLSVFYETG